MIFILAALSLFGLWGSAIMLAASLLAWQATGCFWYGLSTIVFGVAFKLLFDRVT